MKNKLKILTVSISFLTGCATLTNDVPVKKSNTIAYAVTEVQKIPLVSFSDIHFFKVSEQFASCSISKPCHYKKNEVLGRVLLKPFSQQDALSKLYDSKFLSAKTNLMLDKENFELEIAKHKDFTGKQKKAWNELLKIQKKHLMEIKKQLDADELMLDSQLQKIKNGKEFKLNDDQEIIAINNKNGFIEAIVVPPKSNDNQPKFFVFSIHSKETSNFLRFGHENDEFIVKSSKGKIFNTQYKGVVPQYKIWGKRLDDNENHDFLGKLIIKQDSPNQLTNNDLEDDGVIYYIPSE